MARRLGPAYERTPEYRERMRFDLRVVTEQDALYLLPGWTRSTGAVREWAVACWCGIKLLGQTIPGDDRVRLAMQDRLAASLLTDLAVAPRGGA